MKLRQQSSRPWARVVFGAFVTIAALGLFSTGGCAPGKPSSANVILSGTWDLYYLSVAMQEQRAADSGVPMLKMRPSNTAIEDLKKGKTDAAILGREPTQQELQGLKDYVVGYDAVVMIIDENSYVGGRLGMSKQTSGLRNLTTGDLRTLFGTKKWKWEGDYYQRNQFIDPGSWLDKNPDFGWEKQPKFISCFYNFPTGKYDTQTVLYQSLGLDQASAASAGGGYTSPKLNLEEEVLSSEFPPDAPYTAGSGDFVFKVGFASRRVAAVALKHVPIRIVSVDGIDPLEHPETIYDGTYPFSRRLHLLVRDRPNLAANKLVDFMLSAGGQNLIAGAGYLPVSPRSGAGN